MDRGITRGSDVPPAINDLGFLSNCRSAAMIDRAGSVVWWCPERFDSDSWFGSLLDPDAGIWTLRPSAGASVRRRYVRGTLVVESTFSCETGCVRLTDALLLEPGARGSEVGVASPCTIARLVECVEGRVEIEHIFEPRPRYGEVDIELVFEEHAVSGRCGSRTIALEGDHGLTPSTRGRAVGCFTLEVGESRAYACSVRTRARRAEDVADVSALIADTASAWRSWNELDDVPGGTEGGVATAVRVLKGLSHAETGAVVAAPTTSLPEILGGKANWDYRFGWLRDAALVINAQLGTSCSSEARAYLQWMSSVALDAEDDGVTQAFYGIDGERDLEERILTHLAGF